MENQEININQPWDDQEKYQKMKDFLSEFGEVDFFEVNTRSLRINIGKGFNASMRTLFLITTKLSSIYHDYDRIHYACMRDKSFVLYLLHKDAN